MERTEDHIFGVYPTENTACRGFEGLPAAASADAGYATGQRVSFLCAGAPVTYLISIVLARHRRHVCITVNGTVGYLYTGHEKTAGEGIDLVVAVSGCLLLWVHMHQRVLCAVQKRCAVEVVDATGFLSVLIG